MGRRGKEKRKRVPLSNRDLLIIAVLSGIGGVMSTYVGYLGNLLNRIFGVPFGAGQFVAGLHVLWIIIAVGLIRKPGAGTATGLFKGIIELLTGSTHGLVIVLVSFVQGLLVDGLFLIPRNHRLIIYMLVGGVATASNVFVFQILYFSGSPISYILFIAGLAFISGILLAGSFGHSILEIILEARPFKISGSSMETAEKSTQKKRNKNTPLRLAVTAFLIVAFATGAIYYYAVIFTPPWVGPTAYVEGMVEKTLSFQLSSFKEHEKTVHTDLQGEVTYIPPQDYTGIPLLFILQEAGLKEEGETLQITATDGYQVEIPLPEVMEDDEILLTLDGESLRLVAANYPGGYWVKRVHRLTVK